MAKGGNGGLPTATWQTYRIAGLVRGQDQTPAIVVEFQDRKIAMTIEGARDLMTGLVAALCDAEDELAMVIRDTCYEPTDPAEPRPEWSD